MDSLEYAFEHEDMPLNDEILALVDFGDLTASQLDSPFVESSSLSCMSCNKTFTHRSNLWRHVKAQHSTPTHICPICRKGFGRSDKLAEHMAVHSKPPKVPKPHQPKVNI